jgi:hypothetical protein
MIQFHKFRTFPVVGQWEDANLAAAKSGIDFETCDAQRDGERVLDILFLQ